MNDELTIPLALETNHGWGEIACLFLMIMVVLESMVSDLRTMCMRFGPRCSRTRFRRTYIYIYRSVAVLVASMLQVHVVLPSGKWKSLSIAESSQVGDLKWCINGLLNPKIFHSRKIHDVILARHPPGLTLALRTEMGINPMAMNMMMARCVASVAGFFREQKLGKYGV